MGHVFISYRSEDGEFVAEVIRQLDGAGFRVWSENERLRDGDAWRESIDQAIRDAFAMIVVLTPAAHDSQQIMYEWMFALGVGVRVILVIREETDLHPRLTALKKLKFLPDMTPPWGKLIRVVQEGYDNDTSRPLPPPSRFGRPRPGSAPRERWPGRGGDRGYRNRSNDWLAGIDDADEDEAIEKLIEVLEDTDRDKRMNAAIRLGEMKAKTAIPALIARLRDDDYRVREEAARTLGKLKAAGAVMGLIEAVRMGRPGPFGGGNGHMVFIDAIRDIGVLAVPVLVDALSDEDPRMRLTIVDLLGEIGGSDAVTALAGALRDPEWRVRWRVADALGKLGDDEAVPDLLDLLTDSSKDVRVSAAWALGKIGHASAIEGLINMLRDREWRVRWGAAEALWEIGESAVPRLVEMLSEPDEYVRRAAARALAQVGAPAIDVLIETLDDSNWDVRWSAASALQEIGDPAVKALVKALAGEKWQAAWAAAETLKRIGTPDAMQAVEQWRAGRSDEAAQEEVDPENMPDEVSSSNGTDDSDD